jgi:hypothetical protein
VLVDTNFRRIVRAGAFIAPNLSAGFAPFGISNINGNLYVRNG